MYSKALFFPSLSTPSAQHSNALFHSVMQEATGNNKHSYALLVTTNNNYAKLSQRNVTLLRLPTFIIYKHSTSNNQHSTALFCYELSQRSAALLRFPNIH